MTRSDFDRFYNDHYLPEHLHPGNVALHVAGTVGALVFAGVALLSPLPWLALLFPVVHVAPGLVGHRLFERNAVVGDARALRTDFPRRWFFVAGYRLTLDTATGLLRPR